MNRINFSEIWIKWIRCCVKFTYKSILINGSPTQEFKGKRGLYQGDSIALFFFIMVAEGLGDLM